FPSFHTTTIFSIILKERSGLNNNNKTTIKSLHFLPLDGPQTSIDR
ncbi:15958_t:CDS:2, partial [Entrophospora sp. SA101]